ncbi:hypothetical protein CROQUDRAFT_134713 [Cronartium quercuum f. sp. fusiforme G11]|uniref:J domain-containing protein n=1 Tax=Cronartium quercuum f. sp. fusiforme G11 TaxID=708437 RepID=A0A9P6ND34_9BASI|nr:hypothetical protein CROQUDRAFT_134713 [Cronartium quercuum f. sp. fusiforme G11]
MASRLAFLGDLSPLFSFFAWWFLPGYLSSFALGLFYRFCPSYCPPALPPQPTDANNKPVFDPLYEVRKLAQADHIKRHRIVAHASVIVIYLIYAVLGTYSKQAGTNYYSTLGLQSNSIAINLPFPGTQQTAVGPKDLPLSPGQLDESGLKSHWRKLARTFHPDKLNPPTDLESEEEILQWKSDVESKFIRMREAYETLSDGTKRWAYDRFGPVIGTWKTCVTLREFLIEGIKMAAPFYTFTVASLSLAGSLRKTDPGAFWRWAVLFCILTTEVILMTSTTTSYVSTLLSYIFPNRATFEHIALLRQIFIASSCVTTQLGGIRYPPPPQLDKTQNFGDLIAPIMPLLDHAQQFSNLANTEVVKMIYNDLFPILNDGNSENETGRRLSLASEGLGTVAEANEEAKVDEISEDVEMKETIKNLKEKMLDVFCDLRLQSDETGRAAWNQAIQEDAKRQNKGKSPTPTPRSRH